MLDLNAVAIPAGTYQATELAGEEKHEASEGQSVLPFSITMLGMSGSDAETIKIAERFEQAIKGKRKVA